MGIKILLHKRRALSTGNWLNQPGLMMRPECFTALQDSAAGFLAFAKTYKAGKNAYTEGVKAKLKCPKAGKLEMSYSTNNVVNMGLPFIFFP